MNRIGKRGRANKIARDMIAVIAEERGLNYCEIRFSECGGTFGIAPAHKHKRDWYNGNAELLADPDEWVVACQICHDLIEVSRALTDEIFRKLRPNGYEPGTTPIQRHRPREARALPIEAFDIEGTEEYRYAGAA